MDKYTAYGTITKILFGDSSEVLNLGLLRCDDVESGRHVLYLSTVLQGVMSQNSVSMIPEIAHSVLVQTE
jgi:hypothetical protein